MPTALPLRTGDPQRLGAYELSGRLGEGGQGVVYLGTSGDEVYAVKLLHGPVGDERTAFLREVELAKHVARFCTAQVMDAGFDEGRPYIVSEYIDGPSLQREVALTGPRGGAALERLAVSTATALAAIHRAGIVHRDFKPQNVLLGVDGPRVIDFGLARALDAAATMSGRGVGTPAYMAPEQITASAVTGAADVFSWGATMCFAANASAPFGQDSVAPVLHRILTAQPELGQLDGRLRELVAACLDKDARNRPASRELLFSLLGDDSEGLPAEVLRSPPAHILRVPPVVVDEPLPPPYPMVDARAGSGAVAQPEATGTPDGYRLGEAPVSSGSGPAAGVAVPLQGSASGRTRQAVGRAAFAVTAAILVSVAMLVTVLLPALDDDGGRPLQAAAKPPTGEVDPTSVTEAPRSPAEQPGQVTTERGGQRDGGRQPTSDPPASQPTTGGPVGVQVPLTVGMSRSAAAKALKRAGFVLGEVTQVDSRRKIGQVLASTPGAGATAARGSTVSLQVSAGLAVPSVVGTKRKSAEAAIKGAGLAVGGVTTVCSERPDGQVLSSDPGAGTRVSGGSRVSLTVADHGTPVPSVIGQQRAAARAALRGAGFTVTFKPQVVVDESQVDVALGQSLAAGNCGKPGAGVVVTVGVAGQGGPDPTEPSETPPSDQPEPPG
ncbi:serine/threonine-protein kinase [Nonomuraea rhizosphaerae]|uniref:serine/threonine-protein kinase n=1 Tax=Nonomuraea rhizosphaerae TaxID=2665663 RepID=UPI001C60420A|nr:serine/threonine-protein kinase [Nonomuraea rhizosphaerae]